MMDITYISKKREEKCEKVRTNMHSKSYNLAKVCIDFELGFVELSNVQLSDVLSYLVQFWWSLFSVFANEII